MTGDPRRSWTPIRRGQVYCAPACGRGCTWREYRAALTAAQVTVRRLGEGWRPRVWENMGWHYAVVSECNRLEVWPSNYRGWHAFLREPGGLGGQFSARGRTPQGAIRQVVEAGRRRARELAHLVEGL